MARPVFLMSPPRRDWGLRGRANFKSRQATEANADAARVEWARLADAIVATGGEVLVMPPAGPELTGLIYTAEAGEFFRSPEGAPRYLLPTMAAAHRRAEVAHIKTFVEETLGFQTHRVAALWEAQGDAIRALHGDTVIHTYGVGPESRTSQDAYEEVAAHLSPQHIQIGFRARPWFHGNTFLQFFRHRAEVVMLVCPEALLEGEYERLCAFVGDIAIVELSRQESEGYDTNALQVGDHVIAPESFSEKARSATDTLDLTVTELHLGELFTKGGGAPVCLTNRLWGIDAEELPDGVRWSVTPTIEAFTDQ
jgi:N-dimethylarginine dimethylaminohydrolase